MKQWGGNVSGQRMSCHDWEWNYHGLVDLKKVLWGGPIQNLRPTAGNSSVWDLWRPDSVDFVLGASCALLWLTRVILCHISWLLFKVDSNFTHRVTDYGQQIQEYPEIPVIWQKFLSTVKLSLQSSLTSSYLLLLSSIFNSSLFSHQWGKSLINHPSYLSLPLFITRFSSLIFSPKCHTWFWLVSVRLIDPHLQS